MILVLPVSFLPYPYAYPEFAYQQYLLAQTGV